jgi:hypothetical protein
MTSRATPFQRDVDRMIDALTVERPRVGAADEALVRRAARPDSPSGEKVSVHSSAISDPTGNEAIRRDAAMEQRELYRNDINAVWAAIKELRRHTDDVLRNEPLLPHGAPVCSTRKGSPTACTNFASPHTNPHTGLVIDDLCDACWYLLCPLCYVRPRDQYRQICDACRKRGERHGYVAA